MIIVMIMIVLVMMIIIVIYNFSGILGSLFCISTKYHVVIVLS